MPAEDRPRKGDEAAFACINYAFDIPWSPTKALYRLNRDEGERRGVSMEGTPDALEWEIVDHSDDREQRITLRFRLNR